MELYDCNLKEYIHGATFIDDITVRLLFYQMIRAVHYLHAKGVCHRDIKPENFLMKKNKKLVLCDLGSAKVLIKNEPSLSYVCSRSYRAPELLFGDLNYSNSIDIWSLGCTFAEILLKRVLFSG